MLYSTSNLSCRVLQKVEFHKHFSATLHKTVPAACLSTKPLSWFIVSSVPTAKKIVNGCVFEKEKWIFTSFFLLHALTFLGI